MSKMKTRSIIITDEERGKHGRKKNQLPQFCNVVHLSSAHQLHTTCMIVPLYYTLQEHIRKIQGEEEHVTPINISVQGRIFEQY